MRAEEGARGRVAAAAAAAVAVTRSALLSDPTEREGRFLRRKDTAVANEGGGRASRGRCLSGLFTLQRQNPFA